MVEFRLLIAEELLFVADLVCIARDQGLVIEHLLLALLLVSRRHHFEAVVVLHGIGLDYVVSRVDGNASGSAA